MLLKQFSSLQKKYALMTAQVYKIQNAPGYYEGAIFSNQ